jgi:hypothetical protein
MTLPNSRQNADDGEVFTPHEFHPSRPGIVAPVRVDPSGEAGPTEGQARGRRWRRSSHGWYVPSDVDPRHPWQRAVEAAVCLPGYGGVTGWAALSWLGDPWFNGLAADGRTLLPVPLATGLIHVRPQRGILVSEERCSPRDLIVVDGLPLTTAVRSTCFEMRYAATDWAAVSALDMAAYSDLVSIEEAWAYALDHPGWTGIPRCRDAIALADENVWSPPEVRMREVWQSVESSVRPRCNAPVFDLAGRLIGVPDLLDPVLGVVGEYDGAVHLEGRQRAHDLRREGSFREHRLEYVTMVGSDLGDPSDFVRRLHTAFARAAEASEHERSWTIQPPPWWTPTHTVAQRRSLPEWQRGRLLSHRLTA